MIAAALDASSMMLVCMGLSKAKVVGMLRVSKVVPTTRPLIAGHLVLSIASRCSERCSYVLLLILCVLSRGVLDGNASGYTTHASVSLVAY